MKTKERERERGAARQQTLGKCAKGTLSGRLISAINEINVNIDA